MNFSKLKSFISVIILLYVVNSSCSNQGNKDNDITPNQFRGTDIERILAAIDLAKRTTNKIIIPSQNSNGTNIWLIDKAILLPSNMTVILDNCTIQLSDKCRDNIFRSDNVGEGINEVKWNYNICIIGVGNPVLKGANNPRATGDSNRKLVLDSQFGKGRISYGSDAGKEGMKQTGDWRNFGILMAFVDGFKLANITLENTHGWAITHERVINAELSYIRINNRPEIIINGNKLFVANRDGIDLRHGCKNFLIDHISGVTGDDFIALTILGLHSSDLGWGSINSSMATSDKWRGTEDNIENVFITNINCETKYRGIAIRAMDSSSVNNVFINGLITKEMTGFEKYHNAMLVGGAGYGNSLPGRINNIFATNIYGIGGNSLIHIEQPIADCYFMNGIYKGPGQYIVSYNYIGEDFPANKISKNNIGKNSVVNVKEINMIKVP